MTAGRQATGRWGEAQTARWYEGQGYTVLARNWRVPGGELDLIVARGREIVFCEVKSRSSTAFGPPAEAVTAGKQARIRRLALRWLSDDHRSWEAIRFDVACVVRGQLTEVIESAF